MRTSSSGSPTPSRCPPSSRCIGAGTLPEVGPNTGYNNLTLLLGILACVGIILGTLRGRRQLIKIGATVEESWITYTRMGLICVVVFGAMLLIASGRKGFPVPGLILIALVLIYGFIASKTIVGRHIYAVGGNRHAAELSGVRSKRVNFLVMANMSFLAALAGMMFVGPVQRLRARSTASAGSSTRSPPCSSAARPSAAASGTVIGSIIGGLVMAVLNNGLQLLGAGADVTQMIKGLVLLVAVAFDIYNKSQGRPSITGLFMRNRRIQRIRRRRGRRRRRRPRRSRSSTRPSVAKLIRGTPHRTHIPASRRGASRKETCICVSSPRWWESLRWLPSH